MCQARTGHGRHRGHRDLNRITVPAPTQPTFSRGRKTSDKTDMDYAGCCHSREEGRKRRSGADCSPRSEGWETAKGRGAAVHALGQTLTPVLWAGLGQRAGCGGKEGGSTSREEGCDSRETSLQRHRVKAAGPLGGGGQAGAGNSGSVLWQWGATEVPGQELCSLRGWPMSWMPRAASQDPGSSAQPDSSPLPEPPPRCALMLSQEAGEVDSARGLRTPPPT